MITFDAARTAVEQALAPLWNADDGTLHISESGLEDDLGFMVEWGAREWLVDGDPRHIVANNVVTFVSRFTGVVTHAPRAEVEQRLAKMRVVSASAVV